jgi:hypothetical protein
MTRRINAKTPGRKDAKERIKNVTVNPKIQDFPLEVTLGTGYVGIARIMG